jgi:predicted ATP-dependent serine protease
MDPKSVSRQNSRTAGKGVGEWGAQQLVRVLGNGVLNRLFVPRTGEAPVGRTELLNERHNWTFYRLFKSSLN